MAKVFFETHGCSLNFSESEQMMGMLQQAQFDIVDNAEDADIIVANLCSVKGDHQGVTSVKRLKEAYPGKKMVAAGCITKEMMPGIREIDDETSFISTHNITNIVEVMEEVEQGNVVELIAPKMEPEHKINLPKVRRNKVVGIVPILEGCADKCSFCSTKLIKSILKTYPIENIVNEIRQSLSDGCKEIWLTSQDNGAYGVDLNKPNLPELLRNVTDIKSSFFVRVGMMNPSNVLVFLDELIEAYKNEKIFKFIHVPIQSGNDEILKKMNRQYTVDDFKSVITAFRKAFPMISVSSDFIVGFPTETDEQFNDTLNLMKEIKVDVCNISRFAARKRTPAMYMEQLDGGAIKNRSRIMTDIYHNIARMQNEKWIGWTGEVMVDEPGKNGTSIARNDHYKQVIVPGMHSLGTRRMVKITGCSSFDLKSEIIE